MNCLCGCGKEVKQGNRFILGHNSFKKFLSIETRQKLSDAKKGPNNGMYGKTPTEEHRRKIGEANKNREFTVEHRFKLSQARKGKPLRDETKKKISDGKIGSNNPNWKGGISCEPYCQVWVDQEYKESIKERDGYRCLNPLCNNISDRLCIHHINYDKKDCQPNNLITICLSCNIKANYNRDWHKHWYRAILLRRYKI